MDITTLRPLIWIIAYIVSYLISYITLTKGLRLENTKYGEYIILIISIIIGFLTVGYIEVNMMPNPLFEKIF